MIPRPCSPRAGLTTTAPTSSSSAAAAASSPSCGHRAAGHPDAGPLHQPAGDPLVVAAAHRDRAGELRQRLAGDHAAAPDREPQLAELRVGDLHADPAAQRLLGDDPGVGVELLQARRPAGEQRGVDRVLALDADRGDAGEAELAVQDDRALVVVHHRQVEVGAPAARRSARRAPAPAPRRCRAARPGRPPPGTTGWCPAPGRRRRARGRRR